MNTPSVSQVRISVGERLFSQSWRDSGFIRIVDCAANRLMSITARPVFLPKARAADLLSKKAHVDEIVVFLAS